MTKYAPRTSTAAVAKAKSWVGRPYPAGWCQKWTMTEIFGAGGVGDYDGDKAADAEDGWKAAKVKVPASKIKSYDDIPAGVAVYWSGGSRDNGHASVSAGSGDTYTTDLPKSGRIGRVAISEVKRRWGLTFLGYVTVEGHGLTLTDKPKGGGSVDKMDPDAYDIGANGPHVTWLRERLGVHGFDDRSGPATFSEDDRLNVQDFQLAQGWTGTEKGGDADGFPGPQTLALLAANPRVTVPPPAPETKDLIVLPRDEWTSTPNGRADRPLTASKVVAFTIHYPGDGDLTYRDLTEKEVAARLRAYRLSHLGRGWADIGYNYAIDQAGRVWFLTGDTIGAHSNDAGNPTSIGVLFVVGNTEKPTPAAIAAFRALRAAKLAKYPKATKVQGHQQVPGNQTSCPGAPIMALIRAGTLSGSGAPTPAPGPDPAPEPKPDLTDLAWIRALTLNIKGIYNGRLTASRARGLAKIIGKSRASLVNAQEVGGPREAKLLLDALNAGGGNWKYTRFGGSEPIATAVYWDDDKYLLLADEQLETEGTHRWGTGCVFRHRESRVVFVDVTSHLQYLPKGKNTIRKYDQERERQWRAILQQGKGEAVKWRDELNLDLVPVIGSADMNGDANDAYDGPGKAMASEGFNDSDRVAAKRIDGDKGTTANTDGKFDKGNRIDRWSLDDEGVECVEQETWFGYPHTDHNGVSVSLKITNRKAA